MYIDDSAYIDNCFFLNAGTDFLDAEDHLMIGHHDFVYLEARARKAVDRLTQGRIRKMKEVPLVVKMLMVRLIPLEYHLHAACKVTQPVKSFSNDGYSETYAEPFTEKRLKELEYKLITEYLDGETDDHGVPLLCLGVD